MNAGWKIKGMRTPKEITSNMEDDWSEVSSSRKGTASKQLPGRQTKEQAGRVNEGAMGPGRNYYEVLQQDDNNGEDEEEDEENQESEEVSSSFNPTYSDVDSQEYTASGQDSKGSLNKDNDAFFERLAKMTRELNVELPNYGRSDSHEANDNRERVASESEAGPRKSGRVTRAPKRLIEEISGLSKRSRRSGMESIYGRHPRNHDGGSRYWRGIQSLERTECHQV
jgi:hypothetical protein